MNLENIKKLLENAITITNATNKEKRLLVYKAALKAVSSPSLSNPDNKIELIKTVIEQIEKKYEIQSKHSFHTTIEQSNQPSVTSNTPTIVEAGNPKQQAAENLTPEPNIVLDNMHGDQTTAAPETINPKPKKWILWSVATTFCVLLSWMGFNLITKSNTDKIGAQITVQKSKDSNNSNVINETVSLLNLELPQDAVRFSTNLKRDSLSDAELDSFIKNEKFTIENKTVLFAGSKFDIDPKKGYFMSVTLRINGDATKRPIVNIGFATFNKDGILERAKPGPHRYFVNAGRLNLTKNFGENIQISNLIEGIGNNSYKEFRPTTKSVRPILLLVPEAGTNITISKIEIFIL